MIKGLLKLAIVFMVAHALYRFVPPYWAFTQFKWELKEEAVGWREYDDAAVQNGVLEIAQRYGVPLTPQQVRIRREPDHLFVDASYVRRVEFLPGFARDWTFEAAVDAWTLQPPHAIKAP